MESLQRRDRRVRPAGETVRLTYPGGGSDEFHTRRLHKNFGVPRLSELRYVVFAVKGCVRRIEALEKGKPPVVTVLRRCNPKSVKPNRSGGQKGMNQ